MKLNILSATLSAITGLTVLVTLSSCHHKDLDYDDSTNVEINVVFDWRNAPEANPSSMATYFFTGGQNPLRYIFSDITGGIIKIPYGYYDGLCLNSDNTDWALMRNTSSIDSFEIYTRDASTLTSYGISSRALPRDEKTSQERLAATPGMLWSHRCDTIDIPEGTTHRTITFYPEEVVCHYTVDVTDIVNITSISGSSTDATLSGMSESYLHGKKQSSDTRVTMPFVLTVNQASGTMHSEFLTFGESPVTANPHMLTVYIMLNDGSKWYHTFDVTSQVSDAPDPHNVHIVVSGIHLPATDPTGSGLRPNVNDWQTDDITIKM